MTCITMTLSAFNLILSPYTRVRGNRVAVEAFGNIFVAPLLLEILHEPCDIVQVLCILY